MPWLLVCLVGSWLAVTCMPWSLCLGGWLLVGRFVVGVPLVNVPWSLCPAGWCAWWWLPAYLGARVLLVNLYKYPRKILSLQLYEVKETFLKLLH